MNTGNFIKTYCKPTIKQVNECSIDIMMSHVVDYETIREYLVAILYQDYLQTYYWKSISKFMRSKFKKCKCGEKENLHVHHNTYMFVGIEHLHINCLDVLCQKCHSLIHSCINSPRSEDRGIGYEQSKDLSIKKYKSISTIKRSKIKPSGKSQNKLLIELLVKNQLYEELRVFKKNMKLPIEKRMSVKQKHLRIQELIGDNNEKF